jgi:tetrahydromethanopterin S-methyltransferase subunit G
MKSDRATADIGAVCGLVLGIILGSALLNLAAFAAS